MSSNSISINYLRYVDPTNIHGAKKNLYVRLYHVDTARFNNSTKVNVQNMAVYLSSPGVVKQKISSNIMESTTSVAQWDNVSFNIRNINANSGLVVFVMEKNSTNRALYFNDKIIDYYYIPDLLANGVNNNTFVYNADNFYLMELESLIAQASNSSPLQPVDQSSFYSQYRSLSSAEQGGNTKLNELIAEMNQDIFVNKCLMPTSSFQRVQTASNFSIHYKNI